MGLNFEMKYRAGTPLTNKQLVCIVSLWNTVAYLSIVQQVGHEHFEKVKREKESFFTSMRELGMQKMVLNYFGLEPACTQHGEQKIFLQKLLNFQIWKVRVDSPIDFTSEGR